MEVGVLAGYRVGNRLFQRSNTVPFMRRTSASVASDLIQAPIYFQAMVIGVAKLHGYLPARPAAAFKVDSHIVRTQMKAAAGLEFKV